MGLSKVTNEKSEIGAFQVMLEMATLLEKLQKDPKALEKAAKEAYALSDAEQEKAAAAKALIAQSEAAATEAKKQQIILDAKLAEYTSLQQSTDGLLESIRKEQARIAKVDAELGRQAIDLEAQRADLIRRESALERGNSKLLLDSANLDKRAQRVIEDETALKAKADKLRGLMDE